MKGSKDGVTSLNDAGCAFVLFQICGTLTYTSSPEDTGFYTVMEDLFVEVFGGVFVGAIFAIITERCLSHALNNFQNEVAFALCMCHLAFYFVESIKSSGVFTVVFMALMVSKNKQAISPLVEKMRHFWEMVGFVANTLLCFITGQVIAAKVAENVSSYGWHGFVILIALYTSCHMIRTISVWHLFAALEAFSYGCTLQDGIDYDLEKDSVLLQVRGNAFLTLLVNATTVCKIVSRLKLNNHQNIQHHLVNVIYYHHIQQKQVQSVMNWKCCVTTNCNHE